MTHTLMPGMPDCQGRARVDAKVLPGSRKPMTWDYQDVPGSMSASSAYRENILSTPTTATTGTRTRTRSVSATAKDPGTLAERTPHIPAELRKRALPGSPKDPGRGVSDPGTTLAADDGTIRASRHLITTPVAAHIHARCGALTLTGHAEGLSVRADTAALNTDGEIAALCDGLPTYTLLRSGLVHRDAGRIAGRALSGPTLAAHRCHRQIPAAHRAATAPTAATADPDTCPY